jgi:penicillin-binding protein 2
MIQEPPPPFDDRRTPMSPQLARRVAILGTFALTMFAIIFFRLWFIQILSGQKYVAEAKVNRVRDIGIPAPRGEIMDRSGNLLVDSKRAIAVQITPAELPVPLQATTNTQEAHLIAHPPRADVALYHRLGRVLKIPNRPRKCPVAVGSDVTAALAAQGVAVPRRGPPAVRLSPIACLVAQGFVQLSYANVTLATDVPRDVLFYLEERQHEFRGVSVQPVWLRTYPLHEVAAQLFGTVGPISASELKQSRFKNLPQNAIVGQSGLEWFYNRYLQGTDGKEQVQVNALGQAVGAGGRAIQPTPGGNLRLSLDVSLQRTGEQSLAQAVSGVSDPNGGAFVALNPVNGEVYAMGSNPSFDPNVFTHPITKTRYDQLFGSSSDYPLINRAIQTAGPTGSTFKPITATAALESGAWTVSDPFDDTGQYCFSGQCRHNAGGAAYGVLDLEQAIKVSSDNFFYNLGVLTNDPAPRGGPLQHWARKYGIGRPTGIDVGGEVAGNLPDAAWRNHVNHLEYQCDHAIGPFKGKPKRPPGGCGIADGTDRPWAAGDNENLAVGQGDVQVTPLQLAVAYSAIANGGNIVRPHLGLDIQQPDGTLIRRISPPIVRHLHINPLYLDTIRTGLRAAASQPGGTSFAVMGNFPEQVYGKTGTAQYNGQPDYSWYSCFVPPTATSKPIEVVVTVPRAGFGAQAAAPVARQILSQWFFGKRGPFLGYSSGTGF